MDASTLLFYGLQFLIIFSALAVVLVPNPIYSALFLVLTMVGVAAIFVSLDAMFIAGVQLVVYAGAVMVLFVMVLMLFNLQKEKRAFSRGFLASAIKLASVLGIGAVMASAIVKAYKGTNLAALAAADVGSKSIKDLATLLFTKYIFGFELISILLLIVIVGAVSLSRAKGGTHA